MKHTYSLYLNDAAPVKKPVEGSFGNNHTVRLHIRHAGILIIATSGGAEKKPEDVLHGDDDLFADAIRKALLIYLMRYGKCLSIRTASVLVNGTEQATYRRGPGDPPLIYSLVEGNLRRAFTKSWQSKSVEQAIATRSKSAYDGRHIALNALLVAKSDRYEIERFTFYWMAMNALYNFTASMGEPLLPPTSKGKKQTIDGDKPGQAFLLRCLGYEPCDLPDGVPKEVKQKHINQMIWSTKAVLKRIPENEIDGFYAACLAGDETNLYVGQIRRAMRGKAGDFCYDFAIFPFMVVWFPYKLRCASFHGDKSLPTFCYAADGELHVIRVVNRLLDIFLTSELVKWINEDPERMNGIRTAAQHPAYRATK